MSMFVLKTLVELTAEKAQAELDSDPAHLQAEVKLALDKLLIDLNEFIMAVFHE
jgi:hypothetical protein